MRAHFKLGTIAAVLCLAALIVGAVFLPQSFRLTAFSDIIQTVLLFAANVSFLLRAIRSKGRIRWFWALMTLGLALWFSDQIMWTYIEVFLGKDVPDLFSGDIVLFLHLVPLIAALGLRPHLSCDQYASRLGHLDFALLFTWWVYLYVLLVMPWQYAAPNLLNYTHNLNSVYLVEKLALLTALAVSWVGSRGRWKLFYANFFAASLTYGVSSYIANWAIARNVYYTGSLYDVPLALAMVWMTVIGTSCAIDQPHAVSHPSATNYGLWIGRCGMVAAFSLPLFGAWALADSAAPAPVRFFRILVTLGAAVVMGFIVFVRQRLLDREMMQLLHDSRDSFESLKRLQAQIIQSEKMASIGQLVGGAAHELNNPLTAMLGYSDLLLATELSPEQQALAGMISQHVRKTKSLVASLLTFARRAPAARCPVDLNTVVRTAIKLSQPQSKALKISVESHLDPGLPKILGDSNQLLQVCLQVLDNTLREVVVANHHNLIVSTETVAGFCVLTVFDAPPVNDAAGSANASLPDKNNSDRNDGLVLSACQGIIQEHQGRVFSQRCRDGSCIVRIELPGISSSQEQSIAATPQLLWESQPFA